MWRVQLCWLLYRQVWTGSWATRSRISRELAGENSVLAFRSLSVAHEPPPAGNVTPANGVPWKSTAETMRTPPVARTANSFVAAEAKFGGTVGRKSDQTKAPLCKAFAPLPAAKLPCPAALLATPPGMTAPTALVPMMFSMPPPMKEKEARDWITLFPPPAMVEYGASASIVSELPPPIVDA